MSEVSVVRQEPLQLNRFTTETVERNGITFINRPEGVVASWEPPPGFNPQAHAQQHNLSNIGYETHTDSITGETRSIAYTEMTHEEYEELRQSPKARTLELPPMVPEKVGNNFGQITFKPAANPVRAELANPPEIPPEDLENPEAPEGERTSKKLDDLKAQREANNKNLINTDTADEYVRFDELHGSLNELISNIKGEPGTAGDYAAQGTRGLLGFAKDALIGVGELAYEGSKLAINVQQSMMTPAGIQGQILDAQILLEEIRLGNVTTGTMTSGATNTATSIGKAIVSPVTKPWAEGQYVESVTRGLAEIATLPLVALKSSKAVKTSDAINDTATANKTANTTGDANKTTTANDAVKTSKSTGPNGDGGKVEKKQKPKRQRPEPNGFDGPDGFKTHGIKEHPLKSEEGQALVAQYKSQGMTHDAAVLKSEELLASGSTYPKKISVVEGDKLYKVVPEGTPPGKYSAYFGTKEEIASLKGLSYDDISDRLGIPLQSQQTIRFDIVEVTAIKKGNVFESVIAPTTQNGYAQPGGGVQTLITDRSAFSAPVFIGKKLP